MRSIDQANSKLKSSHQKYGKNMKLTPPCRDISWQEVSNKVMQPFIYPSLPMHFSPFLFPPWSHLVKYTQHRQRCGSKTSFDLLPFLSSSVNKFRQACSSHNILPICQIRYKNTISGTVTLSKQVCLMVTEKNGKWSRVDG